MSNPPADLADEQSRIDAAEVRAAGGVVWRRPEGPDRALEILLIHRPRYDDWSLPKGKLDEGEGFDQAAIREIREETGVVGDLGEDLGAVFYTDHKDRPKVVRWWAVEVRQIHEPTDTDEVDEFRWTSIADAVRQLTYDSDRGVLDRFRATVAE